MKKVLIVLGVLIGLLLTTQSYAQNRGVLRGIYASTFSVTTEKTINFPFESRDVWFENGSAIEICVDIRGNSLESDCENDGSLTPTMFAFDAGSKLELRDFATSSITFRSQGAAASPVTVIVTY